MLAEVYHASVHEGAAAAYGNSIRIRTHQGQTGLLMETVAGQAQLDFKRGRIDDALEKAEAIRSIEKAIEEEMAGRVRVAIADGKIEIEKTRRTHRFGVDGFADAHHG